jgi:hypothetical protein
VKLENAEAYQSQPAPVFAPVKIAQEAEEEHEHGCHAIVWQYGLQAVKDVVSVTGAVLPFEYIGTKALVCKAFYGIEEGILGEL